MTAPLTIGRFRIERALGVGAFSTVWLARDEDLEAWVAVKVLAESWARNDDARRRFTEEARALRHLDSDRIVRAYELGRLDDDRPFMVMEYADRGTLEDRMRFARETGRPFTIAEAVAVGIELAACLTSVHALRIVHRDVKPSNVLFRSVAPEVREALHRSGRRAGEERMLLGDFGIARRMEAAGLTMVVGSPQYMAPEQADHRRAHLVDGRADVYSAGVVLYEVLAGTSPWPAGTDASGAGSTTTIGRLRDIRDLRRDAPGAMADAIHRALSVEPDARQPTAWEFRAELVRSLGQPPSGGPSAEPWTEVRAGGGLASRQIPPGSGVRVGPDGTTQVLTPPIRTLVGPGVVPLPSPAAVLGGTDEVYGDDEELLASSLGPFDAAAIGTIGGLTLAAAAILPWAVVAGPGGARTDGLGLRPGTIVFACGGAMLFAALLRFAFRGRRSLGLLRALAVLAGLTAVGVFVYELLAVPDALPRLVGHGVNAGLGTGLWLVPPGAVFALIAAVRARRQLDAERWDAFVSSTPRASVEPPTRAGA